MKRFFVLFFLGCALAGCSGVGSVYPIYTKKDTVFLPELLGTWGAGEGKDMMAISRGEGNSYAMSFREGNDSSIVTVNFQLTKIGHTLFADVFSEECQISEDMGFSMPVHLFVTVEIKNSQLQLGFPDMEWFNKYLDKHRHAADYLGYEKRQIVSDKGTKDDGYRYIYLTGNTKHVRSFLKKVAKFPEAFASINDEALVKVSESQTLPSAAAVPAAESVTKPSECCQGQSQEVAAK